MIAQKKIVVYTSGTFDMFHSNHLKMIKYARGLGDTLIVGRGLRLFSEQSRLEFVEEARKAVAAQPLSDDAGQHLKVIARGSAHP